MIFAETQINGVHVVELEPIRDDRGFFSRVWCRQEFADRGLNPDLVQCSISFNFRKGTLRGMHLQARPHREAKTVRCTNGAIYDVVIDLRRDSPTFMQWTAVELSAANRKMLYIPEGLAHGFLTLADNSEVFYQMSDYFAAESGRGVRWNDPHFRIHWPIPVEVISPKDQNWADFDPERYIE
jgi:dTDP-4-dehydrorhamnose 3,5-epimerase